ncbi:putative sugar O-methyltransferase [Micromonospora sp. NBC_01796]|uniref:putative sugar O-methyltransferase n=1 Tax=Micromonospora sp. NBC_01796 TaxID=2975987 RepID=UPI002DD8BFB9|nr:putative sugar O-methyltransferase [Micromonospora sp. NBC_01796]WSA87484.1 putative sugar O-methyltransferase [Micromonospora sp. NBC_01796]
MADKYGGSTLWDTYHRTRITKESSVDLAGFKSAGVNFKLALWNPRTNGVRYLKSLIYNVADGLDDAGWQRLRRIGGRETGAPIAVRIHGELVCMDYLQAVLELEFMERHVALDGGTVLEIGAGYGRTCHAVLANHDVAGYYIVDLENSLDLARAYLREVLDADDFAKVRFVPAGDLEETLAGLRFDLCLNIDSFAEMDAEVVRNYLAFVARHCRHLYVKNPVGKYLDPSLDDHAEGQELVAMALRTGLLRDVIDIHDSEVVRVQSAKFVDAYRPAAGWTDLADEWAPPWSYYWQALYRAAA